MVEFNSVMVVIAKEYGIRERRAYIFKGRWRGWEEFITYHGWYVCGYSCPRYPVPATMAVAKAND